MNHSNIKKRKTEEIYGKISDKPGLLKALSVDFVSTYKDLFGDGEDETDDNGNYISWSAE